MYETTGRKRLAAILAEPDGLSQTRLAARLGVSQPAVSEWIAGNTRPSAHLRTAIEMLVGIPAGEWMTAEERSVVAEAMREGKIGNAYDSSRS